MQQGSGAAVDDDENEIADEIDEIIEGCRRGDQSSRLQSPQ
jgi:hypothetical protein